MLASCHTGSKAISHFLSPLCVGAKRRPGRAGPGQHGPYLVGAVGVGDPGEGLQGGGDGVGQEEGPGRWTVLLHLTQRREHAQQRGREGEEDEGVGVSPCPPGRTPAAGRRAPDSSGSA